jgi:hypothetical protein
MEQRGIERMQKDLTSFGKHFCRFVVVAASKLKADWASLNAKCDRVDLSHRRLSNLKCGFFTKNSNVFGRP